MKPLISKINSSDYKDKNEYEKKILFCDRP